MNQPNPVLAIGLDSAEPRLIEKWMNDGKLPNLKALRSRGAYGRLKSSSKWMAGSPWPTFFTGTEPAEHGIYENIQWRAQKMQYAKVTNDWLPVNPFYRQLSKELRIIAIDVPMTQIPEPFNGIEICGWLTYDLMGFQTEGKPTSYPKNKINILHERFGLEPFSIKSEEWGLQKVKSLLGIRDELIQATQRTGELAKTLMKHENWDLFMLALAAPHRGGHKLWDLSGTYGRVSEGDRKEFSHAMQDLYIACDEVVGELIEAASIDTKILVFSLHGMGPNTGRSYLLPKILPNILARKLKSSGELKKKNSSIPNRLKKYMPSIWLSIGRNPESFIIKLIRLFESKLKNNGIKINSSPAFSLRSDMNGYIRISLRGREKDGIVDSLKHYDRLCADIIEEIKTLVDVDTGEPVVAQVVRSDELFKSGSRLEYLPDLIVRWVSSPSINQRAIALSRDPFFSISTPKRNLDGRGGNHRSEGFLIAVGSGMAHNSQIYNGDILDLAPTICDLLGICKPVQMKGNSLWTNNK